MRAEDTTTAWSIAALDQILAKVPPGRTTARIEDMKILVSNLKSWRGQLAGLPQPRLAFDGNAPTWPNGNVYYAFSNNVSAAKQRVFLDCAAEWSSFANVQFIPRTTQANYVTVYEDPTVDGGVLYVGMTGGQQFLWLGTNGWSHYVVCHEMGHTLGLVHEHQRSDRDAYILILTNNVQPGYTGLIKLTNSRNQTAYDFHSIMHYGPYSGAIDPAQPTMVPLPAYSQFAPVGQDDPILTPLDRAGMAKIYGAGPLLGPEVTNTQDSGPGSLRASLYYAYDHPGTTVTFNIPATDPGYSNGTFTIRVTDQLPCLMNATTVDGSTQPGAFAQGRPVICINGALCLPYSTYANGLRLRGANCVVRGLVVNGFQASGLLVNSGAKTNVVSGNFIGLDASGTASAANHGSGITVASGAEFNLIGGYSSSARNLISGNGWAGITITDTHTFANTVAGNYIGVTLTGTSALSNGFAGIEINSGAVGNHIGGPESGAGNLISGNGNSGILIRFAGASSNVVQGNFIGVNASGTAALPNAGSGVNIYGGGQFNLIGGSSGPAGNLISGNGWSGVSVSDPPGIGNVVAGNLIGLNASGLAAIGNGFVGIEVNNGASQNVIGGTLPGAGNVISGNTSGGIMVRFAGTSANLVQGNLIGLNVLGTAAIPNSGTGINLYGGAQSNIIGGAILGARNTVSGNDWSGVSLSDSNTLGNVVSGNYIGVDPFGATARGNAFAGIELDNGTTLNTLGGTAIGAGNVISANGNAGIIIRNPGSANNLVQGNLIGLDAAGTAYLPNAGAGVLMYGGARSNLVGGVLAGAANLIAGNLSDGVTLSDASTTNNSVRANCILDNRGVAIALNSGANDSAPAPSLASAVLSLNTTVSGSLRGPPNTACLVDFYSSPRLPAQGLIYLGAITVMTDAGGAASFTTSLPGRVPAGRFLAAAATDPAGNTSPMSSGVAVTVSSSVNDGIPDAWRALYFGGNGTTTDSRSCATCDPDRDGMNNLQEFFAGTNPTNAASVVRLNALPSNPENNVAGFLSAPGVVYRILYRDELEAGFWSIAAGQMLGTGSNILITDPDVVSTPNRFYRLQVLW